MIEAHRFCLLPIFCELLINIINNKFKNGQINCCCVTIVFCTGYPGNTVHFAPFLID